MGKQILSAAPGGVKVEWEDFKGKLFVIEPLEVEHGIKTSVSKDPTDAVRANVYVVLSKDGSKAEEFEDTLVFPRVIQGQIRRKIGSFVVGRLGQGEAQRGKNPPWVLAEASEADLKAATAFLSSKTMASPDSPDDDFEDEVEDDDDAF